MKHHEMVGEDKLLVRASTRAGLISAAVQGMMTACGARSSELDEEKTERPFSLEAEDFGALLAALLAEAATQAKANNECYEDITFTLITDKKAVGALVGKKAVAMETPRNGVKAPDEVLKNEAGEWEVTLKLK